VELSGALSNPFARSKSLLKRVFELHATLLRQASETPRPAPAKAAAPVLEAVTHVLEGAGCAMRTIESPSSEREINAS
jgi:hypothetical protein